MHSVGASLIRVERRRDGRTDMTQIKRTLRGCSYAPKPLHCAHTVSSRCSYVCRNKQWLFPAHSLNCNICNVVPFCELAKTSGNVIGWTNKTQSKTKLKFAEIKFSEPTGQYTWMYRRRTGGLQAIRRITQRILGAAFQQLYDLHTTTHPSTTI